MCRSIADGQETPDLPEPDTAMWEHPDKWHLYHLPHFPGVWTITPGTEAREGQVVRPCRQDHYLIQLAHGRTSGRYGVVDKEE